MVNCPRCGTPNPDQSTACLACETPLAGQKFAQALDRAQARTGDHVLVKPDAESASPDNVPSPAAAGAPPAAPLPTTGLGMLGGPLAPGHDDVDQFLLQAQARAKRRRRIYLVLGVMAILAIVLYFFQSARQQRLEREAAVFLKDFTAVDDGIIASFWRCTVRAKHADIHRASDNLVVTDGLTRAFAAHPRRQPRELSEKCLPMLVTAGAELDALAPPKAFEAPLAAFKQRLQAVHDAFAPYTAKLEQARDRATSEQRILEAARSFHIPSGTESAQAIGYVSLLRCVVPGLAKMARSVRRPPDTQPLIETIYDKCKADPAYADQLRRACLSRLDLTRADGVFRLVARRMAGDDRDIAAIENCFEQANKGFFREDLAAIGKSWVEYRNALKAVMNRVTVYKGDHATDE